MTEPVDTTISDTRLDASADIGMLMASLRSAGAARYDPVRWRYLEALAERAAAHQESVKRVLDAKLAQALAAFNKQFDLARCEAGDILSLSMQHYPHAADALQRLFDCGDFKALRRDIASLKSGEHITSLSALVRQLAQHSSHNAEARVQETAAPREELKTLRNFRNTWSKLSVDKQVAQALEQAPKNAGPINSHMLVLRSLALMRELSPDYLNRFISYADTLLCLEQDEKEKTVKPVKPVKPRKPPPSKSVKKA